MLPTATSSTCQAGLSADAHAIALDTVGLVRRLFTIFPQLTDSSVDRRLMIDEWTRGLVAVGITPAELERGLAACRTARFAPSLGEFCQLCRPSLDPEVAWIEAERGLRARERGEVGVWSHPAVWRAACAMSHEIRGGAFKACRKRWEYTLRQEFANGWGGDVPPVAKRIEHRPAVSGMPEDVRRFLARQGFEGLFNGRSVA